MKTSVVKAIILMPLLFGCVHVVDPHPDYRKTEQEVIAATGADALYEPGEEALAQARVASLLEGGLSAAEAVQVALLNNATLRELLHEVGLSRADAVQAGLLSNPSLDALLRIPIGGGALATEGGIMQNLIELWQIPWRRRVAEAKVERTVLSVAHHAALLASQAKATCYQALAAGAAAAVEKENLKTVEEFLKLTEERRDAGAATQVDVNAVRSVVVEQGVRVRAAEFAAWDARRRVALVLGLAGDPADIEFVETFSEGPDFELDFGFLLEVAQKSRLDLRAAIKNVEVFEKTVPLEKRLVWRNVEGGLTEESDGGDVSLGPSLNLSLPIFDQNQAQIARAEYRYAQALRQLEGICVRVTQEVRGAQQRYAVVRNAVDLFRSELLPLRESSLSLARESFVAGKTGFLSVLEAQNELIATRRTYVDRMEELYLSIPELEAACGRPLEDLLKVDVDSGKGDE